MEVPDDGIAIAEYYAVHYHKKYYFGRALSIPSNSHTKMKFLHNGTGGEFEWPRRDDTYEVLISSIFYGSFKLEQCYSFTVRKKHEIEKICRSVH